MALSSFQKHKLYSMEQKKEELKVQTMEKELEELRRDFFKFMEFCVPPKEVRDEIAKNLYTIPLSLLKIMRTLLDYEIKVLEERIKETEKKPKSKRIKIE
ncbi:MAG TPA: hypothetical protein EYP32_00905 [Aquificaceae bacterium]|nr:hypothetical protein [Aquificaceae bacterium]HIQ49422.1 hypothetical protein [Aquifex aeolicus]